MRTLGGQSRRSPPKGCSGAAPGNDPTRSRSRILRTPRRSSSGARAASLYGEADAAVDALASFFIELGLEPGDKIAVQLPNLALQPLTLLAAWRAGLTVAAAADAVAGL